MADHAELSKFVDKMNARSKVIKKDRKGAKGTGHEITKQKV